MLLLAGLGNPGSKYERNRHNVGFMAVDAIHTRHGFAPWRTRFNAHIAEGHLGNRKILLMKPTTFMNNSGQAVGEAARFYKLTPDQIVVIYDELDLPPGKTRVKQGGGHGGHNGLRSLHGPLGADYRRVRIGIGHPGHKDLVANYVLHDFAKADDIWLTPLLDAIAASVPLLAEDKDQTFMNQIHLTLNDISSSKTKQTNKSTASSHQEEKHKSSTGGSLKQFKKSGNLFSAENCDKSKNEMHLSNLNETKNALTESLAKLFGKRKE